MTAVSGMAQYARQLEGANPLAGPVAPPRNDDEALKTVTREFESLFLNELLKDMRAGSLEGGLFGKDRALQMYREMHDEALAGEMARAGGLGIGKLLYDQLRAGSRAHRAPKAAGILA